MEASGVTTSDAADDRILRAKYLDWCSARVTNRLFQLTPEQIYELAQQAAQQRARSRGIEAVPEPPREFAELVGLVTDVLTRELQIPSFAEWRAAYGTSPQDYEDDMIGLWREST